MFIGHFGAGLAAKKIDARPSLGTMFLASQFIDLLWPLFLLLGLEQVKIDPGNTAFTPLDFVYYPFSHGFLSVLFWSLLFGLIYYKIRKNLKGSVILGFLVLSHWLLDFITHRPDLPLIPWSDFKAGLGLWNSVVLTIILEGLIFIGGAFLFLKVKPALNKKGKIAFWALLVFLIVVYITNVFGPPPPGVEPLTYVGFSQWILIGWAYWIDKNRT